MPIYVHLWQIPISYNEKRFLQVLYKKPKHVLYVQVQEFLFFFQIAVFWDNVEKYSTAGLATWQYNMTMRFACWIRLQTHAQNM